MSSYASVPNLPAPQSDDALRKTAASQVDLEINQSVAPIQSQIGTTQRQEDRSLGQVAGMFNAIQPVVNEAAKGVQTAYNQATAQQQQIFAAAQAQLQQLRGQRAGDAQALAQQIGGPVALDEFTRPFDDAGTDLTYLGAGQELHTLAYAQAGVQQANEFAGGVFPLVRTEQMASVRNQFEDQIREFQDQITALKSQKGAQVNKRFNELRTQELQYGLQRAQFQLQKIDAKKGYDLEVQKAKTERAQADRTFKLDKQQYNLEVTKADRDFRIALRAAGNDDKRIKLAEDANDQRWAEILGKWGGKKTLAAVTEDHRAHEAMVSAGLSKREIEAREKEIAANAKTQTAKLKSDQRTEWATLLDNAITPKPGSSVTHTYRVEVPSGSLDIVNNPDVYYADGKYWKNVETHETVGGMQPITDPNRLVDYLVTAVNDTKTMPRSRAEALVRARLGLAGDWKYGDPWPPEKKATPAGAGKPGKGGGRATASAGAAGAAGSEAAQGAGENAPDPMKTYYTPGGPMKISDANQIASGAAKGTERARENMRRWLAKQGFPVPDYVQGAYPPGQYTPKGPAAPGTVRAGNERLYNPPKTKAGKPDIGAIRREARAGNDDANAWLRNRGYAV